MTWRPPQVVSSWTGSGLLPALALCCVTTGCGGPPEADSRIGAPLQAAGAAGLGTDAGAADALPDASVAVTAACAARITLEDCDDTPGFGTPQSTYAPGGAPELNLIGLVTTERFDRGVPVSKEVSVHVESGGPMILALSVGDETHWTVTVGGSATVERIVILGYETQSATAPPGIPVEICAWAGGCLSAGSDHIRGYLWPDDDTRGLFMTMEALTGRSVTSFAGCYSATKATVAKCDCQPPTCEGPEALAMECGGPGGVPSSDPAVQAWLGGVTVTGGCGAVTLTNNVPAVFSAGCPGDPAPTVVTFTATDEAGNTAQCTSAVTVVDTIPPEVTLEPTAVCLWPPANALVDVANVTVSDVCDPDAAVTRLAATSDEATATERGAGGPVHCPDARLSEGAIQLRAERAGPSGAYNGRVYGEVGVAATDRCGNTAEASLPVGTTPGCPGAICVPHDQDPGGACGAVDDGQVDATICN